MVAFGFFVFLPFLVFCVIAFVPIKIKTHKAPLNDRLNLSFVKDVHIGDEKGQKWL
mgnify:CR=1 FL=1